ncbi:MAG: hypothetical protein ACO3SP_09890, partial [Ilumatobacteraceae bacterium]
MDEKGSGGKAVKRALGCALVGLIVLGGCSSMGGSSGDYDFDCPDNGLVQVTLLNLSNGSRDELITGERLDAVQVDVERSFDCDAEYTLA